MKIYISGASGLVGSSLAVDLGAAGHTVNRLVRNRALATGWRRLLEPRLRRARRQGHCRLRRRRQSLRRKHCRPPLECATKTKDPRQPHPRHPHDCPGAIPSRWPPQDADQRVGHRHLRRSGRPVARRVQQPGQRLSGRRLPPVGSRHRTCAGGRRASFARASA